jgi:hypothetical protein
MLKMWVLLFMFKHTDIHTHGVEVNRKFNFERHLKFNFPRESPSVMKTIRKLLKVGQHTCSGGWFGERRVLEVGSSAISYRFLTRQNVVFSNAVRTKFLNVCKQQSERKKKRKFETIKTWNTHFVSS